MKYSKREIKTGIEVEGLFSRSLLEKLKSIRHNTYEPQGDGSVNIARIFDKIPEKYRQHIDRQYAEVSFGEFGTVDKLVRVLGLFTEPNYYQDSSCGLHLHISLGKDNADLYAGVTDFGFINTLQRFAYEKLCNHVQDRRHNSRYCKPYQNYTDIYHYYLQHDKYRFVRNHPQGTLEYRFFAPCEHKVENIKKFMDYFFQALAELQTKKYLNLSLGNNKNKTLGLKFALAKPRTRSMNAQHIISPLGVLQEPPHRRHTESTGINYDIISPFRVFHGHDVVNCDCSSCADRRYERDAETYGCSHVECESCRNDDCTCDCHN